MNTILKRLYFGGIWALTGKGTIVVLSLAINATLARILEPSALGEYFVLLSIALVIATIAQVGLNQAVVRFIAESNIKGQIGKAKAIILNSLSVLLPVVLVITAIFVIAFGPWLGITLMHSEALINASTLIGIWIAVIAIQGFMAEIFRGFHDIRRAVLLGGVISQAISLGGLLLYWYYGESYNLISALCIIIAAVLLNIVIGFIWLGLKMKGIVSDNKYYFIDLFKVAWPAWVASIMVLIMKHADIWILGASVSHQEVALYGAAARFSDVILVPLMITNAVVPPIIAELYSSGRQDELEKTLKMVASATTLLAIIIIIPIVLVGQLLLELVYGSYYSEAITYLLILAFGGLINVWTGSCGVTLLMTGHQATYMILTLMSGTFLVVGSIYIVTIMGPFGVAVVVACSIVIQNLLSLVAVRFHTGMWVAATVTAMFNILDSLRLRKTENIFRQ
jgi:O-antigen/teichoic acid export membrane protein